MRSLVSSSRHFTPLRNFGFSLADALSVRPAVWYGRRSRRLAEIGLRRPHRRRRRHHRRASVGVVPRGGVRDPVRAVIRPAWARKAVSRDVSVGDREAPAAFPSRASRRGHRRTARYVVSQVLVPAAEFSVAPSSSWFTILVEAVSTWDSASSACVLHRSRQMTEGETRRGPATTLRRPLAAAELVPASALGVARAVAFTSPASDPRTRSGENETVPAPATMAASAGGRADGGRVIPGRGCGAGPCNRGAAVRSLARPLAPDPPAIP